MQKYLGKLAKRLQERIRYVVAIEDVNAALQQRYSSASAANSTGFRVCYQLPFYDYLAALLPLDLPLSG